jgi:hypothetical protein
MQSETIKCNQLQSEAIRGNQRQTEAFRGNQRQSEAIGGNRTAIRGNQRQSDTIRGNQRQSDAIGCNRTAILPVGQDVKASYPSEERQARVRALACVVHRLRAGAPRGQGLLDGTRMQRV